MKKKKDPFFIADLHFGHENILKFDATRSFRPFETIVEHDEELVRRWNDVVAPDDTTYVLGDFAFSSRYDYLARLNGEIVLVLGNHDYANKIPLILQYGQDRVKICGCMEFGRDMILSHIPVHPSQLESRFKVNIHGHLHDEIIDDPRYYCVSAEQQNLTPKRLSEIKADLIARKVLTEPAQ